MWSQISPPFANSMTYITSRTCQSHGVFHSTLLIPTRLDRDFKTLLSLFCSWPFASVSQIQSNGKKKNMTLQYSSTTRTAFT
jgi:hypothetical protein